MFAQFITDIMNYKLQKINIIQIGNHFPEYSAEICQAIHRSLYGQNPYENCLELLLASASITPDNSDVLHRPCPLKLTIICS